MLNNNLFTSRSVRDTLGSLTSSHQAVSTPASTSYLPSAGPFARSAFLSLLASLFDMCHLYHASFYNVDFNSWNDCQAPFRCFTFCPACKKFFSPDVLHFFLAAISIFCSASNFSASYVFSFIFCILPCSRIPLLCLSFCPAC